MQIFGNLSLTTKCLNRHSLLPNLRDERSHIFQTLWLHSCFWL